MRTRTDDITLTSEREDGFLVVHVTREGGYFSTTADMYASKRAFELGNSDAIFACGQLTDETAEAFPELASVQAMHLADVETGEPMHAASNSWYRLGGKDMAHELDYRAQGRKNYYDAPEPFDEEGWLRPEFAQFFVDMAARNLRCSVDELPSTQDEDAFMLWVETTMRPRWRAEAERVNAWIEEHANTVEIPAEQTREPLFDITLDEGLRVRAKLSDEQGYREGVGWHYWYNVLVQANGKSYRTRFGGSVADHDDGIINAREAAFGVLRELLSFEYESTDEQIRSYGMEDEILEDPKLLQRWHRAEEAADQMMSALTANREVIGS